MKSINELIRPNIKALKPYSSARDEFSGEEAVFLDANENPFNAPYNRYPDPYQRKLKEQISKIKDVPVSSIFLGNGSDEPIDLVYRAFCEPQKDNAILIDPTYGMYQVAADINNVETRKIKLTPDFELNPKTILDAADEQSKLLFLCSPNNPTANSFKREDIISLIENFNGLVILDEAYIDFVPEKSFLPELKNHPNLIILQTFSKAWGMAGMRLGMAFASAEIIQIFNHIKYPYNINILTQQRALELLQTEENKKNWVKELNQLKVELEKQLSQFTFVSKIYPSDANFLLLKTENPKKIYNYLIEQGVVIRDRSSVSLCEGCLRITVGTEEENSTLIEALKNYN